MPTTPMCLGEELLAVPGGRRSVGCYLALDPRYLARLEGELTRFEHCPVLQRALRRFLLCGFDRDDVSAVSGARLSAAVNATGDVVDVPNWSELFAFCDAIPLLS
jgi:hypothetical protein